MPKSGRFFVGPTLGIDLKCLLCTMSKRDADILYFVAFCLEGYKNKHGIKQFLSDHYDVLHTQGMPWILEEIEEKIGL